MADFTDHLTEAHTAFIAKQPVFFTATAAAEGRINLSPKGYDAFRVLGPNRVAWLDLGGSGNETHAHLAADGRITLMFCAFEGPANIVRLYGTGESVAFGEPGFAEKMALFPGFERARNVVTVRIHRVSDSCGWGVPFFEFKSEREQLRRWVDNRTPEEWEARRYDSNAVSIDGLPGLTRA